MATARAPPPPLGCCAPPALECGTSALLVLPGVLGDAGGGCGLGAGVTLAAPLIHSPLSVRLAVAVTGGGEAGDGALPRALRARVCRPRITACTFVAAAAEGEGEDAAAGGRSARGAAAAATRSAAALTGGGAGEQGTESGGAPRDLPGKEAEEGCLGAARRSTAATWRAACARRVASRKVRCNPW